MTLYIQLACIGTLAIILCIWFVRAMRAIVETEQHLRIMAWNSRKKEPEEQLSIT